MLIRHHVIVNYTHMGAGVIWNGTGWDGCSGGIAVFLLYHLIISDSLSTSLIKVHAEQGWNTTLDFPQIKTVFIAIFLCASIHIRTLTLPESM